MAVARRWFATPAGQRAAVVAAIAALESGDGRAAAAWLAGLAETANAENWGPTLAVMRAAALARAGQRVLVPGKRNVNISNIEPIGNYAVLLHFDDGHASGIFSWTTLRELGEEYGQRWPAYLAELESRGQRRDP